MQLQCNCIATGPLHAAPALAVAPAAVAAACLLRLWLLLLLPWLLCLWLWLLRLRLWLPALVDAAAAAMK